MSIIWLQTGVGRAVGSLINRTLNILLQKISVSEMPNTVSAVKQFYEKFFNQIPIVTNIFRACTLYVVAVPNSGS